MRYTLIIAGGSGTRLWPMSRAQTPKQIIPLAGGKSLLRIAADRLQGLVPEANRYVCALSSYEKPVLDTLPELPANNFLGEPTGRDTLNAVALGAAVLAQRDPEAIIAVLTADHVIEPADQFRAILNQGFELVEQSPQTLVTFGITPTSAATGYGYLQLGESLGTGEARVVSQFREKPDQATAEQYLAAGSTRYLWNSGMFIWKASTLLDCVKRYEPANYEAILRVAHAWDTPGRSAALASVYPTLKKISVDYAIMEPASRDPLVKVAALPMPLRWLDVGSWPSFAHTCPRDEQGNALAHEKSVTLDSTNNLIASNDPGHLVTLLGCEGLIVIHTPDATLVCRADRAEDIKKLHAIVGQRYGQGLI